MLVGGRDFLKVDIQCLVVAEEQIGELLQGEVRISVNLSCHGVQGSCLIESRGETDLVKSVEEVLNRDSTFGSTVPLSENAMKICTGGVLSAQSATNVEDLLLVDGHVEVERLVCRFFLSAADLSLELLHRANSHALRKTASLVWISSKVALACFIRSLGSISRVVTCKDLRSPLGLFKLLCLAIRHKNRSLGLLALSVIKFDRCIVLRVIDLQTNLLETVLAHGAGVGELERGVVPVDGAGVALGAEVDVAEAALMLALLAYVHFCVGCCFN